MNKKVIRQFVEQFGKEWECSCKTPFGVASLEVVSETEDSLVAHYVCPNCGKEQMLAASISEERYMIEPTLQTVYPNQITSDDVLDIREEIRTMKLSTVRALAKPKIKKISTQEASRYTNQKKS
jgi:predicted RNA-binding Zn-ribbon protein involved in translation (DUF1610 family)